MLKTQLVRVKENFKNVKYEHTLKQLFHHNTRDRDVRFKVRICVPEMSKNDNKNVK